MTKDNPEEVLISLNRKYTWDLETQKVVEDSSPPPMGFALLKVSHPFLTTNAVSWQLDLFSFGLPVTFNHGDQTWTLLT